MIDAGLGVSERFDDFVFNTNDGNYQITDFNVDEDTLPVVGLGYESEEDILANVREALDGSVLFSDQGTEIELLGISLDEALNMDLVLSEAIKTGDDLGALSRGVKKSLLVLYGVLQTQTDGDTPCIGIPPLACKEGSCMTGGLSSRYTRRR